MLSYGPCSDIRGVKQKNAGRKGWPGFSDSEVMCLGCGKEGRVSEKVAEAGKPSGPNLTHAIY